MTRRLLAFAVLACVAVPATLPAQKADAPSFAGNWKFFLPFRQKGGDTPIWLLKFEQKDGKTTGTVLDTGKGWPKGKLADVAVTDGKLTFAINSTEVNFTCAFAAPKDAKARLTGTAKIQKRPVPAEMERTKLTTLDEAALSREEFAGLPPGRKALQLAMTLLREADDSDAKADEVASWVKTVSDSAGLYGEGFRRDLLVQTAEVLASSKKYLKLAVESAKNAEKLLDAKEPPADQKRVLDVLADVLEKSDKPEDAKTVKARIAKLDFSIKVRPFAGRKGKSDRVVLVELFTGAQCPPCVAADLAFDAVGKSYKPSEVVLLQYHLHVPRPDPLTNADGEARAEFYAEQVRGTPAILFNGKGAAPGGGGREDGAEKYDEFVEAIDPLLETPAKASLALAAKGKDGKISIEAAVKDAAVVGDDVRVRVVLVEETVDYKGTNGLAVHHHVVRAMPGGAAGVVLKEKTAKVTHTVDVAELKKSLAAYLEKQEKKDPFPGKERPLELKKLKVVAFVQNDKTGEVYQAAMAEVK